MKIGSLKEKFKKLIPRVILNSRLFNSLNLFIRIKLLKFLRLQWDRIHMHCDLQSFLKKESKKYDEYFKNSNRLIKHKEKSEKSFSTIEEILKRYNLKSILDIGCGAGFLVRKLLASGYEAKGVDISRYVIDNYSQDLLREKVIFNCPSSHLPFENNSFDLVISFNLLEHIPVNDIDLTLREMFRVCRKFSFNIISLRKSAPLNKIEYHLILKIKNGGKINS